MNDALEYPAYGPPIERPRIGFANAGQNLLLSFMINNVQAIFAFYRRQLASDLGTDIQKPHKLRIQDIDCGTSAGNFSVHGIP
jgi:hypothetical protein